jgi:hypothetical protein
MSNMTHVGLNNTNPYLYLRVTRYIFGMQQWLHNILTFKPCFRSADWTQNFPQSYEKNIDF